MILLHSLTLPTWLQARSFEDFAQERLLASLHTGSTRLGQLEHARILRRHAADGEGAEVDRQFLMVSDWNGLATTHLPTIDDPAVHRVFEAYNARIDALGCFEPVSELQRN